MGKKGKSIHFSLCPYTFFPMGKNGKTHIFPWAKMGLDPPPPKYDGNCSEARDENMKKIVKTTSDKDNNLGKIYIDRWSEGDKEIAIA